ncbi:MAG: C10 family peptidase [[Clostridium] fimetarium]|nr:C10 family peptidase [Alistipes timonensis]MCM1405259.1 C10 family peptidase [[Clostridium] fimetarium]
MRKHHIALCCAVLMGTCAAAAAPLTPGEALSRVRADRKAPASVAAATTESYKLAKTQNDADGVPAVYLFATPGNEGYLLLSADDAAPALLGYSDSGEPIAPASTATAALPPQLEGLMKQYGEEIAWLRTNARPASVVRKDAATPKAAYSDAWLPIAPLLKENAWGQGMYYFEQTPVIDGQHCVVGCGAVAASQVMSYFQWPEKGTGVVGCTDLSGASHSMNLDDVSFDWANMASSLRENSTDAELNAVSGLMKAVGYALNMEYGLSWSSSNTDQAAYALIHNFNYDAGISVRQLLHSSLSSWNEQVYENLANDGPVIIRGYSEVDGGHIFVCDGYSADGYFHFNWGWNGMYNGYFLFSALQPYYVSNGIDEGGFSAYQWGIFGISRPKSGGSKPQKEIFMSKVTGASLNEDHTMLTIYGGWTNNSPNEFGVVLGAMVEANGLESVYVESSSRSANVPVGNGWDAMTISYDFNSLPDGVSAVWVRWKNPEEPDIWKTPLYAASTWPGVAIVKEGSEINAYPFVNDYLSIGMVKMPTEIYNGALNKFSVTFTNNNSYSITSYVLPALSCDYTLVSNADASLIFLESGESVTKVFYLRCDLDEISPDSKYHFLVMDDTYWHVLTEEEIAIKENPGEGILKCSDFSVVGDSESVDPEMVRFKANINCESGYYCGGLRLWLYYMTDDDSSSYCESSSSAPVVLKKGDSKTIDLNISVPNEYRDQQRFVCDLYDMDFNLLGRVKFSLSNAAVEEVVADGSGVGVSYDAASGRVTAVCDEGIDRLEVYSASGALLGSWRAQSGDNAVSADLSAFPAGLTIVVAHSRAGETRAVKIPR